MTPGTPVNKNKVFYRSMVVMRLFCQIFIRVRPQGRNISPLPEFLEKQKEIREP